MTVVNLDGDSSEETPPLMLGADDTGTVVNLDGAEGTSCCSGEGVNTGDGAPTDASYLVVGLASGLSAERAFRVTTGELTATDGGAGSTYTVGLAASGVAAGTYTYATITVDAKGRVSVASSGTSPVPVTRTFTAGDGMTGGGSFAADQTFNVGQNADNSILVNADDIQLNPTIQSTISTSVSAIVALAGRTLTTTAPLTGGGTIGATNLTIGISAATTSAAGSMSAADKTKLDATTLLTTKGDLLGFSTAEIRVAVGTDGWVLTADTGSTAGWKWAAPAPSGYTTIDTNGTPVTARAVLNFSTDFTVADNVGATRTDVSLSSSGVSAATYTYSTITVDAKGRVTSASSGSAPTAYTFSTGLTNATGTITNDLSTGISGGQTATGGTASGDFLKLTSTTNATKGLVQIGATALAKFNENLTKASASAATLDLISFPANTVTVTGTTTISTAAGFNYVALERPTYTDASAVTVTNAATLALKGAPIAAGSVTITNPWALWVQQGNSKLDGTMQIGGNALAGGGSATVSVRAVSAATQVTVQAGDASAGHDAHVTVVSSSNDSTLDLFANTSATTGTVAGISKARMIGMINAGADSASMTMVIGTITTNDVVLVSKNIEVARLTGANNNVLIGTTTDVASTKVRIAANKTVASAAGAVWDGFDFTAATLTLSGSTHVTTSTGMNAAVFRAPTITAGSALTVDQSATVMISGAPVAGGSATLTNAMALWVQGGTSRLDGALALKNLGSDLTSVPVGADGVIWMFGGKLKAMGASGVPVTLVS